MGQAIKIFGSLVSYTYIAGKDQVAHARDIHYLHVDNRCHRILGKFAFLILMQFLYGVAIKSLRVKLISKQHKFKIMIVEIFE